MNRQWRYTNSLHSLHFKCRHQFTGILAFTRSQCSTCATSTLQIYYCPHPSTVGVSPLIPGKTIWKTFHMEQNPPWSQFLWVNWQISSVPDALCLPGRGKHVREKLYLHVPLLLSFFWWDCWCLLSYIWHSAGGMLLERYLTLVM